jgi:membrane protease YdiL (CAAX protease family)
MENPHAPIRDWSALAFASLFPLVMTTIYFLVLHNPNGEPNPVLMTAFWTGKLFQFLFPAAYVCWFERESIRFVGPSWRGIAFGIGFGLTVGISMFALYFLWVQHIPSVAENSPKMINERLIQFSATTPLRFLALAFYICIPHSLGEEYYWRWFVFGWMRRHVPLSVAIALSSIAFMLHHVVILGVYFPGNFWTLALPFSVCVAVGGGVWAWLYQRSGSLYAAWLSHALIDAAIMGLGYWMLWDYWK